ISQRTTMTSFNPISIFMDARHVTRGTPEMLARLIHLDGCRIRFWLTTIPICKPTTLQRTVQISSKDREVLL
ncbi:MAG: hypothetical protein ACXW4E_01400, partial [Anaerolineales bacterium]